MEQNKHAAAFPNALKTGVLFSIFLIIYSIIVYQFSNGDRNWFMMILNLLIFTGGITGASIYYRDKKLGGVVTYGKIVGFAVLFVVISSLITSAFNYLYLGFISPDLVNVMLEQQAEQLYEQGMSDEQIEQTMSISERFMSPGFLAIMGFFSNVIFGVILSLIISAIVKRQADEVPVSSDEEEILDSK